MSEKWGELILKILRALTWRRVGHIAVLNFLAFVSVIAWLDREYLAGIIQPAKLSTELRPLKLTDVRRQAVDEVLLLKGHIISAVGIASVDAPANTRKMIYFRSSESAVQNQYEQSVESRVSENVPLFGRHVDDNKVLIQLINGEVVCRPYGETIASRYLPGAAKYMCSVGIPPGYSGRFRGIVFVMLRVMPSDDEEHRVRLILRDLSRRLDAEPKQ